MELAEWLKLLLHWERRFWSRDRGLFPGGRLLWGGVREPREKGECVRIMQSLMMGVSTREEVLGRWVSVSEGRSAFWSPWIDGLAGLEFLFGSDFFFPLRTLKALLHYYQIPEYRNSFTFCTFEAFVYSFSSIFFGSLQTLLFSSGVWNFRAVLLSRFIFIHSVAFYALLVFSSGKLAWTISSALLSALFCLKSLLFGCRPFPTHHLIFLFPLPPPFSIFLVFLFCFPEDVLNFIFLTLLLHFPCL